MSQIITELARYTQEFKTERKSVSYLITFMEPTTQANLSTVFLFFVVLDLLCKCSPHIGALNLKLQTGRYAFSALRPSVYYFWANEVITD